MSHRPSWRFRYNYPWNLNGWGVSCARHTKTSFLSLVMFYLFCMFLYVTSFHLKQCPVICLNFQNLLLLKYMCCFGNTCVLFLFYVNKNNINEIDLLLLIYICVYVYIFLHRKSRL
jgi:hypothetical protein